MPKGWGAVFVDRTAGKGRVSERAKPSKSSLAGARFAAAFVAAFALFAAPTARAETAAPAPANGTPAPVESAPGSLLTRDTLLGGMGGLRPFLEKYGISLDLSETSEVWANLSGGLRRGVRYDGLFVMTLSLDTRKAFGWAGGRFYASGLEIHGRQISAESLGVLQPVSGIEANRAARLWQLWYRQSFWGGRADVKLGEESVDTEFLVSRYALTFLNQMMGWPLVPSADLYAGGPAYPLSSLGIRLRLRASGALTALAGVFDDNPPGGPFANDSELRDGEASGTLFNLGTGALSIGELQYAANSAPGKSCRTLFCGLPGTYKIGAFFDTAPFPDQRFASDGLSLANPLSNGVPRSDRGNWSLYAVLDQRIWREGPQSPRSLNFFLRPMGAPGDRNLVSFSVNAGLSLRAPFASRPGDSFGVGVNWGHVGSGASGLDRDEAFFSGNTLAPVRSSETAIEVTYVAEIAPWWQIQPDFQYFFRPGGGIPNPSNPAERIGNEAVVGLRTVIAF